MNNKCQVFTPSNYVVKLLDSVNYRSDLMGKKLLENSCGEGNILIEVVRRYIADCKRKLVSPKRIKNGLERDIVGVEIDEKHLTKCINNLNCLLDEEGIPRVKWKIYHDDFLRRTDKELFDFIVGNPPYLTYSDISIEDRVYLRQFYSSCKEGKFDYSYAFIEKSISVLSEKGKMAYLIPSSIFKTVYGENLRSKMLPYISSIMDFSHEKVFDSVLVKSAIIVMKKTNSLKIQYSDSLSKETVLIDKASLGEKWCFRNIEQRELRFGDYFKVSHVVATLLNEAFVLKDFRQNVDGNYSCGKYVIEKELVRDTASPRTCRTQKTEKIIFPYYYDEKGLVHFEETEFKERFPGAYGYLEKSKKKLLARDCDNGAKWYEYGRSQALSKINQEKCLMSTVVSSKMAVFMLSKECVPYSGMYIIKCENNDEYDLQDAINILSDSEFRDYAETVGININGNSVRITSKDIEEYRFTGE